MTVRADSTGRELRGDMVDRLITLADETPDKVLFTELLDGVNESAQLTAADLRDRAAALAGELARRGINPGDVVLMIATPPVDFVVALFGCMWAGVIAAPVSFPRRPEHVASRLEPVRANAGAVAVVAGAAQGVAEQAVLDMLTGGTTPVISMSADGSADGSTAQPMARPIPERDIAYLQYTSGSTSDPRGVIVTHDNLVANLDVARVCLGYGSDSITVSWCPLTHDMGLILGALPAVAFGTRSVLMTPASFIRRPMTWLRAISKYRGTHGYSPNFGYDLLVERSSEEERADLDLSSVVTFVNGAEPVRRHSRDRFLEAFAVAKFPPGAHTPAYGLAEASVIVSANPLDDPGLVLWVEGEALERHEVVLCGEHDDGARQLVADGVPGPGYDVRIVDPETGAELPPDRIGELWVRGPSVCRGYWRRELATAETFGGTLPGVDGTYLRTGDLAFMYNGEIVICGRAKDLIVMHGRNIYPQDIELTAEMSHDAIRSGGSAAFAVEDEHGEALVVVVEVDGEPEQAAVVEAVRNSVLREFELRVADVLLVQPYTVPKTSSGKKQRSLTRRLWLDARGDVPATSST